MRISPITNYSTNFGHHPDFNRLVNAKEPVTASSYFRRGYSSWGGKFTDIVKTFQTIFSENMNTPKKMLIVGVADSQEPFSYLATIKQIIKNTPIQNVLDLYIVDLQSAPDTEKLHKDSYTLGHLLPDYAKDGFKIKKHPQKSFYNYKIKDELFNFLNETYGNPLKSKWESRIQEVIKDYPDNYFDIISMNNVIFYLPEIDKRSTVDNIYRTIKPEGCYITEGDYYIMSSKFNDKMKNLHYGIFQKLK